MAVGLTLPRKWQTGVVAGLMALFLSAVANVSIAAVDARQLYIEALRAQEDGNFRVAEEKLAAAADLAPADTAILLRLALVRGYLRDYTAALDAVDRGLAVEPSNVDLQLVRARILGWAGRHAEALRAIDGVIAAQPDNAEAYTIRGRTEYYRGRLDAASSAFAEALRIDPDNAEARDGLADVADAREASRTRDGGQVPTWRIDTGYLYSQLSPPAAADWNEGFIRIERAWPRGTAVNLRLDESNRFDTAETSVGIGVTQRFSSAWHGYLEGSVAPDGNFLPRSMLAMGGSLRVREGGDTLGGTVLTVDLRHRHYATGDIQNVDPGITQYAFGGRFWVAAKWINALDREADRRLTGWYGRADWQVVPAFRIFAGASAAPETESGLTVDTQSWFGGLAIDLTSNLGLNLHLAREDRENSYSRDVYGLGLTLRF